MRILNSYMVVRMKSMNRMKAIRRITTLVMLFIIIFCFAVTGFDMNVIIKRGSQAVLFIKRMFPPDTGYCGKIIEPLIKTVQMSIAGTFIGAVFGLFTAFLYAGNLIKKLYVRIVVRVIVQCVRTIPVLILAQRQTSDVRHLGDFNAESDSAADTTRFPQSPGCNWCSLRLRRHPGRLWRQR